MFKSVEEKVGGAYTNVKVNKKHCVFYILFSLVNSALISYET